MTVGVVHTAEGRGRALEVARAFRNAGIRTEIDLTDRGIGAQIAHASRVADFVAIIGGREADSGRVTLKNLRNGIQKELGLDEAVSEVMASGTC